MQTDEHRALCWIIEAEYADRRIRDYHGSEQSFVSAMQDRIGDALNPSERAKLLALASEICPWANHTTKTNQQLAALDALSHPDRFARLDEWQKKFIHEKITQKTVLLPGQENKLFEIADRRCRGWRESLRGLYCPGGSRKSLEAQASRR